MQCRSERGNQKNQQAENRHQKQGETCSAGFSHSRATFDQLQEATGLDLASLPSCEVARVDWRVDILVQVLADCIRASVGFLWLEEMEKN